MRLFAGLRLSHEAVQRLTDLRLRLAHPTDGLRWSAPDQWHITLKFFGDVEARQAEILVTALQGIRQPRLELSVEELGLLGAKGILFAAVSPTPELLQLQQRVEQYAAVGEALPESHPFRPHITLARSRNRTGHATLARLSKPALPSLGRGMRWIAEEVLLYESTLSPDGAQYEIYARFPLQ